MEYLLINGVLKTREYPNSLVIPSLQEKASIRPGDHVKVAIILIPPVENVAAERVWVFVETVLNGVITGHIAKEPVFSFVRYGTRIREPIKLHFDNILAILPLPQGEPH